MGDQRRHAQTSCPQPYHARVPLIRQPLHLNAELVRGRRRLNDRRCPPRRRRADCGPRLECGLGPNGHWPSSSPARGSTPRSRPRTMRRRSTTGRGLRSRPGAGRACRGHRRDRARLRPCLQPEVPGPAAQLAAQSRARARDRQAGHPPLPLVRTGGARRAGRLLAELRAAGARRTRGSATAPPAIIHSYSGPLDYGQAVVK